MKVYKDGVVAEASKDQLEALLAAGWERTAPKGKEVAKPQEETPEETAPEEEVAEDVEDTEEEEEAKAPAKPRKTVAKPKPITTKKPAIRKN